MINMKNNQEVKKLIKLTVEFENRYFEIYKFVDTKNQLFLYIKNIIEHTQMDYSHIFVKYGGKVLSDEEINKPITEIISEKDSKDEEMYLLVYREKISLKIVDEKQNTETYNEVDIKDQLCLYIKKFAEKTKANYSQLFALYNGRSLLDERLNIPIDKIINSQDKKDKRMDI